MVGLLQVYTELPLVKDNGTSFPESSGLVLRLLIL